MTNWSDLKSWKRIHEEMAKLAVVGNLPKDVVVEKDLWDKILDEIPVKYRFCDAELKEKGVENFIVYGVPIVHGV